MSERRFQVVFSGDLSLDIDENQVRQNLADQCKYDKETIDKILTGHSPVLKKSLNESTAQRYKDFLDRLGLLCNLVAETALKPATRLFEDPVPIEIRQDLTPQTVGRNCPKCFAKEQTSDSCTRCGLLFSRFEEVQKRRAENPQSAPGSVVEKSYFEQHPEQIFILKAFAVIIAILLLRNLLNNFLFIIFLVFPIGFLVYIRLQAAMNDQSATELLAQHITFMPVMYSKEERAQEYVPKVTYSLIVINILIFYLFELQVNPQIIFDHLVFLPYKPNFFNVPLSAFTALFLHGSNAHLWGNMLFLWAVGTVVERRIGSKRFLLFYIASGITADISYMLACAIAGIPAHLLGASGAIAGVMGIFAVRCYFKSMVFPLPILGIFSLILPISLKVRLNSLVIIGLFFLADLNGGVQQLKGTSSSNIGHWAHIGGILCGIALALYSKLNEDAITERHMDIGSQAVAAKLGTGTNSGEESLRLLLKQDPQNIEALLLLARLRTKFATTEEGDKLYQQVIPLLARSRPEDAMIAYHEYFKLYMKPLDPGTMYRLANIFHRQQDFEMSSRCLEMVCKDKQTPALVLEKALFQCARTFDSMGLADVAKQYYQRCAEQFPESAMSTKAQQYLARQQG